MSLDPRLLPFAALAALGLLAGARSPTHEVGSPIKTGLPLLALPWWAKIYYDVPLAGLEWSIVDTRRKDGHFRVATFIERPSGAQSGGWEWWDKGRTKGQMEGWFGVPVSAESLPRRFLEEVRDLLKDTESATFPEKTSRGSRIRTGLKRVPYAWPHWTRLFYKPTSANPFVILDTRPVADQSRLLFFGHNRNPTGWTWVHTVELKGKSGEEGLESWLGPSLPIQELDQRLTPRTQLSVHAWLEGTATKGSPIKTGLAKFTAKDWPDWAEASLHVSTSGLQVPFVWIVDTRSRPDGLHRFCYVEFGELVPQPWLWLDADTTSRLRTRGTALTPSGFLSQLTPAVHGAVFARLAEPRKEYGSPIRTDLPKEDLSAWNDVEIWRPNDPGFPFRLLHLRSTGETWSTWFDLSMNVRFSPWGPITADAARSIRKRYTRLTPHELLAQLPASFKADLLARLAAIPRKGSSIKTSLPRLQPYHYRLQEVPRSPNPFILTRLHPPSKAKIDIVNLRDGLHQVRGDAKKRPFFLDIVDRDGSVILYDVDDRTSLQALEDHYLLAQLARKKSGSPIRTGLPKRFDPPEAPRPFSEVVREIVTDWKNPTYNAVPYLNALQEMMSIDSDVDQESGPSVVRYFLANASSWRGPVAKRIKQELKALVAPKSVKRRAP